MQSAQVHALRALLAPTGWIERATHFAGSLRRMSRSSSGLLIVGTPADEPWHMTAHLAEESRLAGLPELTPTLVRWAPPPGARPHLSVGIERLEQASRNETVLVVSPGEAAPETLLDRIAGARKAGAAIFALDEGDPDLGEIVHESLTVRPREAPLSFDAAQHLVSFTVADPELAVSGTQQGDLAAWSEPGRLPGGRSRAGDGRYGAASGSLRARLGRLLDTISGSQPD